MHEDIEGRFRAVAPRCDAWTLRVVGERADRLEVRDDIVQPSSSSDDLGAMITVVAGEGVGYAATSDLSSDGLRRAGEAALAWARRTAGRGAVAANDLPCSAEVGDYRSPVERPWADTPLSERVDLLRRACAGLGGDPRIVERRASLVHTEREVLLCTSAGGRVRQRFDSLVPGLAVTANQGVITERRTLGDRAARQGGLEILDRAGYGGAASRLREQVLELLTAPTCPTGAMDLLLAPDQMILQIHESIGHPLELDRILGDERSYAGTSFVRPEMFGSYRYGSELLNVTFDPSVPGELASYGFDDEGRAARRLPIIADGVLLRGIGGELSERRSGVPSAASSRSCSWDRPPIDRMANLNVEPGSSSFDEMVRSVERGVYMETNCSWSIDDSRNKFQFGCEWGRVIEDGKLGHVVRNPSYRGVSSTFWRSLRSVGDRDTFQVLGTPYCGKGEPNQMIWVGHASPACLFGGVQVFGGEQ